MGAGTKHARAKAEQRKAALAATPLAPVTRIDEAREARSIYGRDAPPATLLKWRGELWGDYSWSDLVSMMRIAEQAGSTETWARLTRRMYQDGTILAARGTRLDPISGADFDVTPGGPEQIDALAAADVEAMLRSLPDMPTTLDGVLDAVFVGWSVCEIIWDVKGAWVWPKAIDILEPHRFRFTSLIEPYLYDDGRLGTDPGVNPDIRLIGRPLRENKYIVHMPRVLPDYPIAAGLLRACIRFWWAKWKSIQYWMSGAEVAGNPRAIGKTGQSTDVQLRRELYEQLENISATGVIVTAADSTVEFVAPTSEGSGSIFDTFVKMANEDLVKTILGSTLNTQVGETGGNRALGESQGEYTIDPRLVKDSSAMWATICRDLVTPFLRFNSWRYGGRMPAVPLIKSRFMEELEPQIDDLIVSVGGVTVDEIRRARGHAEWGPERGGNQIAKADQAGGFSLGGPAPALGAPAGEDVADTALNGAQIASLQELLAAVQARTMAPSAAKVAIRNAFPSISELDASAMVDAQAAMPPPVAEGGPAQPTASPTPPVETPMSTAVPAAAPAGQLGAVASEADFVPASGGAPPADPLAPWDLVEKLTAEADTPTSTP